MIIKELVEYIKNSMQNGVDEATYKAELSKAGWLEEDINFAISSILDKKEDKPILESTKIEQDTSSQETIGNASIQAIDNEKPVLFSRTLKIIVIILVVSAAGFGLYFMLFTSRFVQISDMSTKTETKDLKKDILELEIGKKELRDLVYGNKVIGSPSPEGELSQKEAVGIFLKFNAELRKEVGVTVKDMYNDEDAATLLLQERAPEIAKRFLVPSSYVFARVDVFRSFGRSLEQITLMNEIVDSAIEEFNNFTPYTEEEKNLIRGTIVVKDGIVQLPDSDSGILKDNVPISFGKDDTILFPEPEYVELPISVVDANRIRVLLGAWDVGFPYYDLVKVDGVWKMDTIEILRPGGYLSDRDKEGTLRNWEDIIKIRANVAIQSPPLLDELRSWWITATQEDKYELLLMYNKTQKLEYEFPKIGVPKYDDRRTRFRIDSLSNVLFLNIPEVSSRDELVYSITKEVKEPFSVAKSGNSWVIK